MKRFLHLTLIIVHLLAASNTNAQLNFPGYFEDNHTYPANVSQQIQGISTSLYSPYGKAFTPKGDLKVLIICAGLGNPYDNYPMAGWAAGANTFPDWVTSNQRFYTDNSQFNAPASVNDKQNISRFYYEMSKGQFRLTADVYPNRVNIDIGNSYTWGSLNRKVIEKMKTDDPNFDWSKYDKRKNNPNYARDNSILLPDMMPDFVVIIYRYTNNGGLWSTSPPPIQPSNGGYALLDGLHNINYNGYSFDSNAGYTHCLGTANMYGTFIHEMSHNIFDCPHYSNANGVIGKYFYNVLGAWGFMNLSSAPMPLGCANGWERWYLGWIDLFCNGINSDIKSSADLPANGEFILRDFITTGDVIRIKIPNGNGINQYIWLENHNGNSIFEDRTWENHNGCAPNTLPPSTRGVTAYIESICDDRNSPFNFWSSSYTANGIKPFHSKGNYDYSFLQNESPVCLLWGNKIYNIIEGENNPLSGQSRIEGIRLDYNNDGIIPVDEGVNGTSNREYNWIAMRNGVMTYDFFGSDMNFDLGSKLGMSTNPSLINRPIYDKNSNKMSPFYLNGISVSVLSKDSDGNIKVKISYNDIIIDSNLRWTGNIILPDITSNSEPDLLLASNKTLTINKSGTPNRHTKNQFNDFINPTTFNCASNSFLKMQPFSNIIVDNYSTFTLDEGAALEINENDFFTVQGGANLVLKQGANLNIKGSGKIIIKSGGYLCIEQGANINLQDYKSFIILDEGAILGVNPALFANSACSSFIATTGNGLILDYNRDVYIQNETLSTNRYIAGKNIFVGKNVTTAKPQGDVIMNSGANIVFDCKEIVFDAGFECKNGATFEVTNH